MKRFITSIICSLCILNAYCQKDITTFLGIPVDGYKNEMKQKLIEKGFEYNNDVPNDYFEGEFNGRKVNLFIGTNNNKVWRIMLCDAQLSNAADIKIRFNNLCRQFENNGRYIPANLGEKEYTIPQDEDISYEMIVNNKRYDAYYLQIIDGAKLDSIAIQNQITHKLLEKYTQEELDNPTEAQTSDINNIAMEEAFNITLQAMRKKVVWFTITQLEGSYYISMFYDNEYNQANGEDL